VTARARRVTSEPVLVPGEFVFTASDFRRVADLLYQVSGIHLIEAKASLVYSRLAKRVRILGLPDFAAYCDLLAGDQGEGERMTMLSALTTNVTRFFREPHHFEHLTANVLPGLIAAARSGGRVRLWSAGCSAGHEPYTMAMTLLEAMPDAAKHDVRILATDIDPVVVDRARAGRYGSEDVEPISAGLKDRYLTRAGTEWTIRPEVAGLISFGTLNLLAPWPMKGAFDVIFCRNVAIYFDDETQGRVFSRFAAALKPQGRLYIGHSERASVPALESDGLTVYRRGRA
jgi:chemotaxis protein methyltransferase CheR